MSEVAAAIASALKAQDAGCLFSPEDGLRRVAIDGVFDLEALAGAAASALKVEELQRVIAEIWDDRDHIAHYISESDAAVDALHKFSRRP